MLPRIASNPSIAQSIPSHAPSRVSTCTMTNRCSSMDYAAVQLRPARAAVKEKTGGLPRVVSVPALTATAARPATYDDEPMDAPERSPCIGAMHMNSSCSAKPSDGTSSSSTMTNSSSDSNMSCITSNSTGSPPAESCIMAPATTAPHIIYRRCMDADQLAALAATPAAQHCMLVEGSAVTLNEYFGVLPFADVITADASIADQYAFDEADVGVAHIVVHLQRQDVDFPWGVVGTTGSYGKLALNQLISECSSLLSQWLHTATAAPSAYAVA